MSNHFRVNKNPALLMIFLIFYGNWVFGIKKVSRPFISRFNTLNNISHNFRAIPSLSNIDNYNSNWYTGLQRSKNLCVIPTIDNTDKNSNVRMNDVKYFADLLNNNISHKGDVLSSNYSVLCAAVKNSICNAVPNILSNKSFFSFDEIYVYNTKDDTSIMKSIVNTNTNLENLLLGAVLQYINMTTLPNGKGIFRIFSRIMPHNYEEYNKIRFHELVDMLVKLQDQLFTIHRQCITNLKLLYTSKLFNGTSNNKSISDLINLTHKQFIISLQKEFLKDLHNLIPFFFKLNNYYNCNSNSEHYRRFMELILKAINYPLKDITDLLYYSLELSYPTMFIYLLNKWNVEKDVDEFKYISTNINIGAKKKNKLMKLITEQQQQIDLYQKQLNNTTQGSPFSCGFAYRMPDSNLNIAGTIQRSKGNLQISCVPDESAHLLGPYGFTHGVFPGNLGISFNINL